MPITSGFSGFPHFTQRLLLTTSTYSFYFIFFYAKRERILRECTHGVWKRWAGIDRFAKQTRSALPQNYQQIIKNKFFDTSSVSLRLPPSPTGEGLQYFCQRRHFPMSAPLLRPARFAVARHGTAVNPSRRLSVSNL